MVGSGNRGGACRGTQGGYVPSDDTGRKLKADVIPADSGLFHVGLFAKCIRYLVALSSLA